MARYGSEGGELCRTFLHWHLRMPFGNMVGEVDDFCVHIDETNKFCNYTDVLRLERAKDICFVLLQDVNLL